MESPSSTRSQTITRESEMKVTKSRSEQERSALFDITNDSPIVGVAIGGLETPSSAFSKKRAIMSSQSKHSKTPGSGEALLRGQVKNLLQKVEEEAELSKLSVEYRPFLHLKAVLENSPVGLIAPTPANTPHLSVSGNALASVTPSPVEENLLFSQMIYLKKEEEIESEKDMVTRSLFLDFAEKSECEEREKTPATDDDSSSVWSIQANAASSIRGEEDDYDYDEVEEEGSDRFCEEEEEEEEALLCNEELVDELCEGVSKMSVAAKFTGKHTRFVYGSDGELEGVDEVEKNTGSDSAESVAFEFVLGLPAYCDEVN